MPPVEKSQSAGTATAKVDTPENVKAVELTKADAAKAVKREVPVLDKEGKATEETKAIKVAPEEVLDWAVRGNVVTVVTVDGQKLVGEL